jgi:peroxiredoxin
VIARALSKKDGIMVRLTSVVFCIIAVLALSVLVSTAQEKAAAQSVNKVPAVVLSKGHQALCKVKVGDAMPKISLPSVEGGAATELSSLAGKKATVVVFWSGDRRMAREQLADIVPEVVQPFSKLGVSVVGIAVGMQAADAQAALSEAGAANPGFKNLLDVDGKAFALVGTEKLPRTYLLDPEGKILWFDIEYSLGTRRELQQALRAVAGEPNPGK